MISSFSLSRKNLLNTMSKTKETGYLFAKMSPAEENGIGHIIVGEQKENTKLPPTRSSYHFEEGGKAGEKHSIRKWIRDNVMLLITLTGVFIGVVTGIYFLLHYGSVIQLSHPSLYCFNLITRSKEIFQIIAPRKS